MKSTIICITQLLNVDVVWRVATIVDQTVIGKMKKKDFDKNLASILIQNKLQTGNINT